MTRFESTIDAVEPGTTPSPVAAGGLRTFAGVLLAMLAVILCYWTGESNLAGLDGRIVLSLGAGGVLAAALAVAVLKPQDD